MTDPRPSLLRRIAAIEDAALVAGAAQRAERAKDKILRLGAEPPGQRRRRSLGVRLVLAATAVGAAAVALVLVSPWRAAVTVSMESEEESVSVGRLVENRHELPLPLRFSDGSRVVLEPDAAASVEELGPRRVGVALRRGGARVEVVSNSGVAWRFDAGPFQVAVKGTAFSLSWDPKAQSFRLELSRGRVSVRGPLLPVEQTVARGETLAVDLLRGVYQLGTSDRPAKQGRPRASSGAARDSAVPSPTQRALSASPSLEPSGALSRAIDCSGSLPGTLALYDFEASMADTVGDSVGAHQGVVIGGPLRTVPGPGPCGRAAWFPAGRSDHFVIRDAPAWKLETGSIDFWFRADACPSSQQGVITRDAKEARQSGHIRIMWIPGCRFAVRFQEEVGGSAMSANSEVTTREAIPLDRWTHVGVNFGAPSLEIFIDGQRVAAQPVGHGIDGNTNPWVVGASNDAANDGWHIPAKRHLQGAGIDQLRITGQRQAFGGR